MYSPCPEQVPVIPRTYQEFLWDGVCNLAGSIPTEPQDIEAWLSECATVLNAIADDPRTPDQHWACQGMLAVALSCKTRCGQSEAYKRLQGKREEGRAA